MGDLTLHQARRMPAPSRRDSSFSSDFQRSTAKLARQPQIRKAGRLGNDRPSLETRLGVGLSKPWGVWEGGFNERLGRPPAGMRISGGAARHGGAANLGSKILPDMNCNDDSASLMAAT